MVKWQKEKKIFVGKKAEAHFELTGKKAFVPAISLFTLVILILAGSFYFLLIEDTKTTNNSTVPASQHIPETDTSDEAGEYTTETTTLEKQKIAEDTQKKLVKKKEVEKNISKKPLIHKDTQFGFTLTLPSEYTGYWTTKEATDLTDREATHIRFFVDASGTMWPNEEFDVFVISAYPRVWWETSVTEDEHGTFNLVTPDPNDPFEGYIGGVYLDKNERYVFTGSRGHDCPNDELCVLFEEAFDTLKSFNTFNP